jgi:hypothetical protein
MLLPPGWVRPTVPRRRQPPELTLPFGRILGRIPVQQQSALRKMDTIWINAKMPSQACFTATTLTQDADKEITRKVEDISNTWRECLKLDWTT